MPNWSGDMAFNYANAQKTARKLITAFGIDATFNRVGGGTFDPVTGQETGASTTTETVKVAAVPMSSGRDAFDKKTFEDLTSTESRFLYAEVNANSFEPKNGDLVEFESKIWETKGATPLNPTGAKAVMYMVGLKLSARTAIP